MIGAVTSLVSGVLLNLLFHDPGLGWLYDLWAGVMFGAIAQMGFFAYLIFNWLGGSMLRRRGLFLGLQILILLFVLLEVIYLRYTLFGKDSVATYLTVPILVMLTALVVAKIKVSQTHPRAWIPTLFFMVVATLVEARPALEQESLKMLLLMVIPLLVCNTWQVLQLHRLVAKRPAEG